MQHLKSGLLHAAWADDLLFRNLLECPDEALQWNYVDPEWPISRIAMHIVDGAQWYRYVLTGQMWEEIIEPKKVTDLENLRIQLENIHRDFLAQLDLPDELIEFEDENGSRKAMRSTVLNQICYHSTEHRAQIFVALQKNGWTEITADDFDVWAWETRKV